MSAPSVTHVSSRDNPVFKALRSLAHGNTGYRKQGRIWAEGNDIGTRGGTFRFTMAAAEQRPNDAR